MSEVAEAGTMPEKKKRGRPPKKKNDAAMEPPKRADQVNPLWAQYATPAAVLGRLASRLAENATGSGAQKIGQPKKHKKKRKKRLRRPWGQHTWRKRHLAEKRRSKWIAMLVPGMVLYREYKGIVHRVLVRENDYLHLTGHQVYPTLAAVTVAIVGRNKCRNGRWLCPRSTVRFWNLTNLLTGRPM
jgi:hypothetical protein